MSCENCKNWTSKENSIMLLREKDRNYYFSSIFEPKTCFLDCLKCKELYITYDVQLLITPFRLANKNEKKEFLILRLTNKIKLVRIETGRTDRQI